MKILAQSPARISLIGGGTDVPPYCDRYGGKVLSMAINIRQHVELLTDNDKWEITSNTFPWDADPKLFYTILEHFGINGMHHSKIRSSFDGILGAGLGSSGSAAVALIAAIYKLQGKAINKHEIAKIAWEIEVEKMGWFGGLQDQYASAFGGTNVIEITNDLTRKVTIRPIPKDWVNTLYPWMVLFYIGGTRKSKDIQKKFNTISKGQKVALDKLKGMVDIVVGSLMNGNIQKLGRLLDEAWELKKQTNKKVTNTRIDTLYNIAKRQGALGGKICGAGQSGYFLFIISPAQRKKLVEKMATQGCEQIDFVPDWQGVETRIL